MTLEEKRKQWELGQDVLLCITKNPTNYPVVYVVIQDPSKEKRLSSCAWSLLRYFEGAQGGWVVSVDIDSKSRQACLDAVTKAFAGDYPKDYENV